jgi:hypothetical protein
MTNVIRVMLNCCAGDVVTQLIKKYKFITLNQHKKKNENASIPVIHHKFDIELERFCMVNYKKTNGKTNLVLMNYVSSLTHLCLQF